MSQKPEYEYFGFGEAPIGKYKQPKPNAHPLPAQEDCGYPETDVKTTGITVRSGKAQTKGKMARGPMG